MASVAEMKPRKPVRSKKDPITPPAPWHPFRKKIHAACFVVFCILPFFNLIRFDIPRQRFYFLGYELWISEFAIIFFSLMFLMFTIAAISMLYGRLYCGYFCPQMIFSEAFSELEEFIRKKINKRFITWDKKTRSIAGQVIFYIILWVGSVFLAFVFIAYFVEPRDLIQRLISLDVVSAGGIAGAATTLVTFIDFAFVRQRFCKTVCPYGYLQGILADSKTLLVQYHDPAQACIECKKCVRVCPMEIDIRDGAHQIECIHCADCVDACNEVLAKLGTPGLIDYEWGAVNQGGSTKIPWYHRIGLRDRKRWVLMLVLMFYATGLMVALSMRDPVLVQISPQRDQLYEVNESGDVTNKFRARITNRSPENAYVVFSIQSLPGARLDLPEGRIPVDPGESVVRTFDVVAHPSGPGPGVNHFSITSESMPDGHARSFDMTFIMPFEEASP
ncbi:MAG: 4Fe-4S binding protein [Acidobacteriota bacterium]|nr:MAG: 4Fe-4S binding protein [Acidobacteriota bacterium]